MIDIELVRHGAVDSAGCCYGQRHDVALSAEGRKQAAALASRITAGVPVVSSPAQRAQSTAAALGVIPALDARWAERDFGSWETRPWDDCWAEAPEALAGVDAYVGYTPPGGEPLAAVVSRVVSALNDLDGSTVVVTHGGPIRMALRHALGLSWAQVFAIDIGPGTVTRLRRHGETWTVPCIGCR